MILELQAPGLARRMACWIYEGLLIGAVVFLAGYLFGTLSQTREATNNRHALQAFLFIVVGIYFVWLWSRGQTLAMKTWRIRIVDRRGQAITQGRALLRYALCWLWFLPALAAVAALELPRPQWAVVMFAWVAIWSLASHLHPQRQFWHDAMAGTRLISTAAKPERLPPGNDPG